MSRFGKRKQQLIRLLINGKILKEAANEMGIAKQTASNYMCAARKMYGARTTEQMLYQLGKEAR
jgi:hypothetical protein